MFQSSICQPTSNMPQSKQMHIDELLSKIDAKDSEIARAVEEKEQELLIMQEGMDSTLKELSDLRVVSGAFRLLW